MFRGLITSMINEVLQGSYISINDKGNIEIHVDHTKFSKEDIETFYWLWCQLDNEQQLDAIRECFSHRKSLRFV